MITGLTLVLIIAATLRATYRLLITRTPDPDAGPDRSGPRRKPGPNTPNYSSRSTL